MAQITGCEWAKEAADWPCNVLFDYFADGVTEGIITELSHVPWLFVIARNSSFSYMGLAVDVRRIGRELGVRYVLEGSVPKGGERLRVTGQLIDAETGAHLWADRFEGLLEDVFDLQDRITEAVVGAIAPEIRQAEMQRAARKRPESLDAYDHFLRALAEVNRFRMGEAESSLVAAELITGSMRKAGFPVCASENVLREFPDLVRMPECIQAQAAAN